MVTSLMLMVCCSQESPSTEPTPTPTPTPEPVEIKSYTIMTYGCGGKDLDQYLEATIKSVTLLDIPSHINIVGQMKWSNDYRSEWSDGKGGVTRFKFNHATQEYDNELFDNNSFEVDSSSNLAEFIEWARDEAPADEYIILFMGHGNAYHPGFDGDTRAIMRDDEEPVYLGLSSIAAAFETSDAHFGLTFMVSCLMNSLEYATELAPYTDYYLASSHVTSISGGEIYLILEHLIELEEYDKTTIVDAVTHYIDQDYDLWWSQNPLAIDHTLTRCSSVVDLNSAVREFVDIVVALYEEEREIGGSAMSSQYGFTTAAIDRALADAYYPCGATFSESEIDKLEWYRLDYAFDIVDIAAKVAEATKSSDIKRAAANIKSAAAKAIAYQRYINLVDVNRSYYTVMLINRNQWSTLGLEDAGYENTAFDQATGWSRLLKVNNATYIHCR